MKMETTQKNVSKRLSSKRKLKLTFDQLQTEFNLISKAQQVNIKGGGDPIYINGGYLESDGSGIWYYGNNGDIAYFPGVSATLGSASGSAYQLNGTIHISEGWANSSFNIQDFAHEYGHFLQQQEMGNLRYYFTVAIPSVFSAAFSSYEAHNSRWYEQNATQLGDNFLMFNLWNPNGTYDLPDYPSSGTGSGYA